MKSIGSALTLFSLLTPSLAQDDANPTSTISVFLFGLLPLDASIISADSTATTALLSCQTDRPDFNPSEDGERDSCGPVGEVTATFGPEFVNAEVTGAGQSMSLSCSLGGTTAAQCIQTQLMSDESMEEPFTTTLTTSFEGAMASAEWGEPIPVTAGAEKLGSAQATATESGGSQETGVVTAISGSRSQSGVPSPTQSGADAAQSTGAADRNVIRGAGVGVVGMIFAAIAAL